MKMTNTLAYIIPAIALGGCRVFADKALWFKGDYSDFELDLEYKLDPAANSGVIIYTSAKTNPDGTPIQPWLSKPLASLPRHGVIGLQGMHGGARPYFRNLRIRRLSKQDK